MPSAIARAIARSHVGCMYYIVFISEIVFLTIPHSITQGDRITWNQVVDGFNSSSDTLSCFVRGLSGGLNLTGVSDGEGGWNFTILEDQSNSLPPGAYKAQFVVFSGAGRKTLGDADLLVCPSFENLTEFDARLREEKELEEITKAIARLASGAVAEYRIGDRMVRYQDMAQLTQRQRELRAIVARLKGKNGNPNNIKIRFE